MYTTSTITAKQYRNVNEYYHQIVKNRMSLKLKDYFNYENTLKITSVPDERRVKLLRQYEKENNLPPMNADINIRFEFIKKNWAVQKEYHNCEMDWIEDEMSALFKRHKYNDDEWDAVIEEHAVLYYNLDTVFYNYLKICDYFKDRENDDILSYKVPGPIFNYINKNKRL